MAFLYHPLTKHTSLTAFILLSVLTAPLSAEVFSWQRKAEALEKSGKNLEAWKLYNGLLNSKSAAQAESNEIRRRYEALSLKLLFSKRDLLPWTRIYKVKKGDHLSGIALKFKTNAELIKKINGLATDQVNEGMNLKLVAGVFSIRVDKSSNQMRLLIDGKHVKEYSVSTGALKSKTPVGHFKIINKIKNPDWYREGKIIPSKSPKNQLGTRWLGLNKTSYGIHGTTEPEKIGSAASLGCIRMKNKDVEELYLLVPLGTSVTIVE